MAAIESGVGIDSSANAYGMYVQPAQTRHVHTVNGATLNDGDWLTNTAPHVARFVHAVCGAAL